MEERQISIRQFIRAIERLPEDDPNSYARPMDRTQKDHWIGWLGGYLGPGYYGRKNWNRDAKCAYNHVICPELLLYLVRAIPLRPELVEASELAYQGGSTLMSKAGTIRKVVPWSEIYQAFWGKETPSIVERIRNQLGSSSH
jgi:hypothetical protein